ncbi:hypothetical protein [Halocatena halophila]|uniref:hypothetical protein n=1 Tax=Halocatena halophila TaxID=2814576 RepID=UPI002ED388C5
MSVIDRLSDVFFARDTECEPYECRRCGEKFSFQYQVCPDCGGYAIERFDWSAQLDDARRYDE